MTAIKFVSLISISESDIEMRKKLRKRE